MTYYISGPMTGLPDFNRQAFEVAYGTLIGSGHEAINPHKIHPRRTHDPVYRAYLKSDMRVICESADALYMLTGWEHSPGARAEHAVAVALTLPIVYENAQAT